LSCVGAIRRFKVFVCQKSQSRRTSKSIWTMVEAVQVLFMCHYMFSFVALKWCSKVIHPYRQCNVESVGIWSIWYEGHANVLTYDWWRNLRKCDVPSSGIKFYYRSEWFVIHSATKSIIRFLML
jgi:hypothetical protein